MLPRLILTAASLTVAAASAVLLDCATAAVQILDGDPVGLCDTAGSLGLTANAYVGIGLGAMAVLALAWTWIPALRPGERRRRLSPERTLEQNLGRIPEVSGAGSPRPEDPVLSPEGGRAEDLSRRVEEVEASVLSGAPSRETTREWMELLRAANDLHNTGELGTHEFKVINTRLLDLFSEPRETVDA